MANSYILVWIRMEKNSDPSKICWWQHWILRGTNIRINCDTLIPVPVPYLYVFVYISHSFFKLCKSCIFMFSTFFLEEKNYNVLGLVSFWVQAESESDYYPIWIRHTGMDTNDEDLLPQARTWRSPCSPPSWSGATRRERSSQTASG